MVRPKKEKWISHINSWITWAFCCWPTSLGFHVLAWTAWSVGERAIPLSSQLSIINATWSWAVRPGTPWGPAIISWEYIFSYETPTFHTLSNVELSYFVFASMVFCMVSFVLSWHVLSCSIFSFSHSSPKRFQEKNSTIFFCWTFNVMCYVALGVWVVYFLLNLKLTS